MGTHQDEVSYSRSTQRFRSSFITLIALVSAGLLLFTAFQIFLLTPSRSHIDEINAIIESHKPHLEIRETLHKRSISSFFNDLLGKVIPNTTSTIETGIESLLPNITEILGSLLGNGKASGLVDSLLGDLAVPAKFLGVGLASGGLSGLGMETENQTETPTGLSLIAENLGEGLSSTLFKSPSVKALLSMKEDREGGMFGGSKGIVGQAVLALAQGLGGGAASGLKLTTNGTMSFNSTGLNGIAGNFGEGLSSSLLGGVKLSSFGSLSFTRRSIGGTTLSLNIADIAFGLGSGIGQGAAIGLGFQSDVSAPSGATGAVGISKGFAKGLVSSFLQNGTINNVIKTITATSSSNTSSLNTASGFFISSLNVAKIAEGLGVGLISGIGSTITSLQLISADTTSFDDSVKGAATGFGRGLGSEGATLVSEILANSKSSTKASRRRSIDDNISPLETPVNPGSIARRDTPANVTDLAGVLASLNASTLNPLIQTGIDALSCQGVGGIVAVFLGLIASKTISMKTLTGTLPAPGNTTLALPDEVFIISNGANIYKLNPAQGIGSISVNNLAIEKLVGVGATHIIFAILAYFMAIPLLLFLNNNTKLKSLLSRPMDAPPSKPKWQVVLNYSVIPLSVIAFAFGIAFRGGGKHFTSAHEILGLMVFFQTIIAAVTTYLLSPTSPSATHPISQGPNGRFQFAHKINIAILLVLSIATLLTGFVNMSVLSLCIVEVVVSPAAWLALGLFLFTPMILAVGMAAMQWWVGRSRTEPRRKSPLVIKVLREKEGSKEGSYMTV